MIKLRKRHACVECSSKTFRGRVIPHRNNRLRELTSGNPDCGNTLAVTLTADKIEQQNKTS